MLPTRPDHLTLRATIAPDGTVCVEVAAVTFPVWIASIILDVASRDADGNIRQTTSRLTVNGTVYPWQTQQFQGDAPIMTGEAYSVDVLAVNVQRWGCLPLKSHRPRDIDGRLWTSSMPVVLAIPEAT